MQTSTELHATFRCSLERAFKTPMLCDLAKIHTGYGLIPAILHSHNDHAWGQPRNTKTVVLAPKRFARGFEARDTIITRDDNAYWKWRVEPFERVAGFRRFDAEWWVREVAPVAVEEVFRYTAHTSSRVLHPFYVSFTKTIWRAYMKHVIRIVQQLAESNEPFLHP